MAGRGAHEAPLKPGRIYALSSGMMTEKTLSNTFAQRILAHPEHSLFFVGYADPESPAGRLRGAAAGEEIALDPKARPQPVRCRVEEFSFSGHAPRESIRDYVKKLAPKKVLLVHGDPKAVEWFRETLQGDLPGSEILSATPGEALEI